jgi:hypothetical protein
MHDTVQCLRTSIVRVSETIAAARECQCTQNQSRQNLHLLAGPFTWYGHNAKRTRSSAPGLTTQAHCAWHGAALRLA